MNPEVKKKWIEALRGAEVAPLHDPETTMIFHVEDDFFLPEPDVVVEEKK